MFNYISCPNNFEFLYSNILFCINAEDKQIYLVFLSRIHGGSFLLHIIIEEEPTSLLLHIIVEEEPTSLLLHIIIEEEPTSLLLHIIIEEEPTSLLLHIIVE